jgi:hypothetical protein
MIKIGNKFVRNQNELNALIEECRKSASANGKPLIVARILALHAFLNRKRRVCVFSNVDDLVRSLVDLEQKVHVRELDAEEMTELGLENANPFSKAAEHKEENEDSEEEEQEDEIKVAQPPQANPILSPLQNLIIEAAKNNYFARLKLLIQSHDPNILDEEGNSLLYWFAAHDNLDAIHFLNFPKFWHLSLSNCF